MKRPNYLFTVKRRRTLKIIWLTPTIIAILLFSYPLVLKSNGYILIGVGFPLVMAGAFFLIFIAFVAACILEDLPKDERK